VHRQRMKYQNRQHMAMHGKKLHKDHGIMSDNEFTRLAALGFRFANKVLDFEEYVACCVEHCASDSFSIILLTPFSIFFVRVVGLRNYPNTRPSMVLLLYQRAKTPTTILVAGSVSITLVTVCGGGSGVLCSKCVFFCCGDLLC
jgi:hypothetical protein